MWSCQFCPIDTFGSDRTLDKEPYTQTGSFSHVSPSYRYPWAHQWCFWYSLGCHQAKSTYRGKISFLNLALQLNLFQKETWTEGLLCLRSQTLSVQSALSMRSDKGSFCTILKSAWSALHSAYWCFLVKDRLHFLRTCICSFLRLCGAWTSLFLYACLSHLVAWDPVVTLLTLF